MVVNPITMTPDQTLADALELMARHRISGIPITEKDGRLVGILTNRDVRFAGNPRQPVRRADDPTTISSPSVPASARRRRARMLHQRRIEKLLVVDDNHRCIGLITVKDIEKGGRPIPNATKDDARSPSRRRSDHGRRQRASSAPRRWSTPSAT